MKRIQFWSIALSLPLFICISVAFDYSYGMGSGDDIKEKVIEKNESGTGHEKEIEYLIPTEVKGKSETRALIFDLLPGGGHIYTGNYYYGVLFGVLKALGGYSIYYVYRDWKDKKTQYYDSRREDEKNILEQQNTYTGVFRNTGKYKRDYDRAAQHITFSVLANAAVYMASMYFTYYNIMKINEKSIPTFELKYTRNRFQTEKQGSISLVCNFRI